MASGSEKRQRVKRLSIRFTADEFNRISARADDTGLCFAAFMRAAALDGNAGPRAQRRLPTDHKVLRQLLGHAGRIGNNLNQIARALNSDEEANLPELRQALADYALIRNAIYEALSLEPSGTIGPENADP